MNELAECIKKNHKKIKELGTTWDDAYTIYERKKKMHKDLFEAYNEGMIPMSEMNETYSNLRELEETVPKLEKNLIQMLDCESTGAEHNTADQLTAQFTKQGYVNIRPVNKGKYSQPKTRQTHSNPKNNNSVD